jgi:hypothetical protein
VTDSPNGWPATFPCVASHNQGFEIGDLLAIPGEDGQWGCLQVTDLKRHGVGALTTLVVGVLDWHGSEEPTAESVLGSSVIEQGLTGIEIVTAGGYQITGTCAVGPNPWPSNFEDFGVGTTHNTWGWRTAARKAGAS